MPIREYKCKECGDYTEVIQGINEKPLENCSKCGGKLEKLISNSSFVLKGTGWYKTDYGSSKKPAPDNQDKKPENKSTATAAPASGCCSCAKGTGTSSKH